MSKVAQQTQTDRIRELNDQLQSTFTGGLIVIAPGAESLDETQRNTLLAEIRNFDSFSAGDDPYGEHDFGAINLNSKKYFFKIDYYDLSMEGSSPDPSNPVRTRRVMTIMRADEY